MKKFLLIAMIALSLSACSKPLVQKVDQTQVVSEQVIKVCLEGWIVLNDGKRQYAPGGSTERWDIAPNANESDICKESDK